MKLKLKVTVLLLMTMFCIKPDVGTLKAASSTKTISVPSRFYEMHGIYVKSSTSRYVYATNYSGYGNAGYCYGYVSSDISGEWANYTGSYRLYKNNTQYTMQLSNTIDAGKNIALVLKGADSQQSKDNNRINFKY